MRIEQLRDRILSGHYEVPAAEVADAIIAFHDFAHVIDEMTERG